jgi:hypothetical protein
MDDSKIAPFGILSGGIVSFGIILLSQNSLSSNPGLAWLFKPFLWIFVPITLIAILAGVTVAAFITVKKAIIDTCNIVGFATGLFTCYAFIYNHEINVKNFILSLLISFIAYGFYSYVIAIVVGSIKYRNAQE